MGKQNCKKCGSEWNSSVVSTTCPFCGAALIDDSKKFTDIADVFAFIFNEYGFDIINEKRKFISLLGDYAPTMENERRLVKIAIDADVYKTLLELNSTDEDERNICIEKMVAKLQQQSFLSVDWSQKVVSWFAKCLNWSLPFAVSYSAPFSLSNVSHSISSTGFDPIAYEAFSRDPEYVSAQEMDRNENYVKALALYESAYKKGNLLAGIKLALLYSDGRGTDMSKERAYQIFSVVQKKGDPLAKAWISEYYRMGYAVPQDKIKAKEILENCAADLEQMCACGDAEAQYYLGYEYLYGLSLEKNETKAFDLLKKAYASGIISAGVALADCYINGVGCPVDVKWGVTLLEACVKSTNKKAHFELAKLYYFGKHVKEDYKRAFSLFLFAAERGHKSSQDYVGDCYYYGRGVQEDNVKAADWYTKAYEQGNVHAASQLGRIYYSGQGVEADKDKSFYYFKYAADRGNTYSQYFLHYFYLIDGKFKDYEKGLEYLFMAAEGDYTEAQVLLGKLYMHGDYGLEESEEKSYQWFLRAANLKNAEAERIIGDMYTHDYYVEQDPHKSLEWLEKAVAHGDEKAHISIAELYMDGSLGAKDYSKGDKYLSACKEILDRDKWHLQSGLLYKDIADAYYKYGKKQTGDSEKDFLTKATSIYHMLYSNGHDNVLYDYAWSIFVDEVQLEQSVDPIALVEALKVQAERKESARCASLLSKIYKSGYPSSYVDLFSALEGKEQKGPRIKSDKQEAEKWTKVAIQNGDMSAACKFAIELCNDSKRYSEAFEYAKLAHEHGNYQGTFLLGQCYKKGVGVKKDRSKAKELLKIAKANGYSE